MSKALRASSLVPALILASISWLFGAESPVPFPADTNQVLAYAPVMDSRPDREWETNAGMFASNDVGGMTRPVAAASDMFHVKTGDGKCEIEFDVSQAPELASWARTKLAPVLAGWYPKIVAEFPSPGFTAPDHFKITLKPMDGVAYTAGRNVVANSDWLEKDLDGEAVGSLIHEGVHVVQQFNGKTPGWLVEGSADYFRWFKYEPQSHGADMVWFRKHGKTFSPNYNNSYRITANFLNWVSEKYDKDIVSRMNAAMRKNRYEEGLWKKYTGKTLLALGDGWKKEVMAQLAMPASSKSVDLPQSKLPN
jgi:hypothetical protein